MGNWNGNTEYRSSKLLYFLANGIPYNRNTILFGTDSQLNCTNTIAVTLQNEMENQREKQSEQQKLLVHR